MASALLHRPFSGISSSGCECESVPAYTLAVTDYLPSVTRNSFLLTGNYAGLSQTRSRRTSSYQSQSSLSSPSYRSSIWKSRPRNSSTLSRCGQLQAIRSRARDVGVHIRPESWETGVTFNSHPKLGGGDERGWTQTIIEEFPSSHSFESSSLQHDAGLTVVVLVGAFIWVRLFDFFTSKQIVGQKLSRKLVHISSGLIYMLCWPFFSSSPWAPFFAGVVPLANGIRLLVYGLGILKDEGLVKSMSRSGESRELLRGPLYYVVVLYTSTILFWRQSPVGMIALALMCGGDGIADIMGRRFGSRKLPYNNDKSFAGSISMFIFGFLVSLGCMYYFSAMGFYRLDLCGASVRLAIISLAATIVESLPITSKLDDNFTVPFTAFILGMLLFPS